MDQRPRPGRPNSAPATGPRALRTGGPSSWVLRSTRQGWPSISRVLEESRPGAPTGGGLSLRSPRPWRHGCPAACGPPCGPGPSACSGASAPAARGAPRDCDAHVRMHLDLNGPEVQHHGTDLAAEGGADRHGRRGVGHRPQARRWSGGKGRMRPGLTLAAALALGIVGRPSQVAGAR